MNGVFFQSEYADQIHWLSYMEDEWLPEKKHWSWPWRKVSNSSFHFVFIAG